MASRSRPGEGHTGRPAASASASHARSAPDRKESEQQGVRTAEKLLREFYPRSAWGQTQLRLLKSLCLLATREKANVEAALGTFIEMAQAEVRQRGGGGRGGGARPRAERRRLLPLPGAQKDSVPALLAMAQAYMLLKQVPKARTQLKRLAKAPWALAEAEELEKSWLLLADIYCQGSKFDLASELLRRCVQYNKARGRTADSAAEARGSGVFRAQGCGEGT